MADKDTLWTEEKLTRLKEKKIITRALDEQLKNLFNIISGNFQNSKAVAYLGVMLSVLFSSVKCPFLPIIPFQNHNAFKSILQFYKVSSYLLQSFFLLFLHSFLIIMISKFIPF